MTVYTKEASASVKAVGTDGGLQEGQFRALISVFNTIDSYGDVVLPGAFTDTLETWQTKNLPIPVIWAHQWGDIWSHIGGTVTAEQTDKGLEVVAELDLENPTAAQAYKLLKSGRIAQFSFGFDVMDAGWGIRKNAEGQDIDVYELRKLDLFEVGPCLVGVNRNTELQSIKGEPPTKTSASHRRDAGDGSAAMSNTKAAEFDRWVTLQELSMIGESE